MKTIHVTETYLPDIQKYQQYVERIFETKIVTNNGVLVCELQERLEKYLGVKHVLVVSNGTAALQIAYKLLDLKGEVITTPFSFVATTSSLVWEGLKPIFADIDPLSFNMDAKNIEKLITENTSAIVPVHVFGNACEVETIEEIANRHQLKVIYDAAHAFNVNYKGKSVLKYGDLSILSFHATKLFHTIEGGALIIDDDEQYLQAKKMINFGIDADAYGGSIEALGINAKMNEFQAAMGLCILDDIDTIEKERKLVYEYYKENLQDHLQLQKYNSNAEMNYSYFPVLFDSEESLLKVASQLNVENIFPRRYFYPSLDLLPYLEKSKTQPVSDDISKRVLCLPLYYGLEQKIQKKIVDIILNTLKELHPSKKVLDK
ncbi:MAG: DegT/DnrJ/EryC1/StrS family aminotransferase [Sulfurovum sp.]|nr:DegT/DnrJ/EryC1/StrS family aminotransferase [Sulfurovum sp.]